MQHHVSADSPTDVGQFITVLSKVNDSPLTIRLLPPIQRALSGIFSCKTLNNSPIIKSIVFD